jgi:hypothetical protein
MKIDFSNEYFRTPEDRRRAYHTILSGVFVWGIIAAFILGHYLIEGAV